MLYRHPQFDYIYRRSWQSWKLWMIRRGSFRKLARYSACLTVVMGLAALNIAVLHQTSAVGGYLANNVLGQANFNDGYINGTAPTSTGLEHPQDTSVDTVHHRLFVADSDNNRVLIYNLDNSNNLLDKTADFVLGQADFTSGRCDMNQTKVCRPGAVEYDSVNNRLYVADTRNERVLVFDASSLSNGMSASYILVLSDFGDTGAACGLSTSTCAITGLSFDSTNRRLFVADPVFNRVEVFDVTTLSNGLKPFAALGQPDMFSNGCGTNAASLCAPKDVRISPTNRLYVADSGNNRVVVYNLTLGVTTGMNASVVIGQSNFGANFGTYPDARTLASPEGLTIDTANNKLYVSDTNSHRVMVFNLAALANGMSASNVLGQANFTAITANTTQNGVSAPRGLSYDAGTNKLYLADTNNSRMLVFDMSGGVSNNMNASDIAGHTIYTEAYPNATAVPAANELSHPSGNTIDSTNHRLFVADSVNNRVLSFDITGGGFSNNANASNVLGQAAFNTSSATTTQAGLQHPQGLAYDSANSRLFVADTNNNRVLVYDLSGGLSNGMNASHVLGQANFTSNAPTTSQSGLETPLELAYDAINKRLFVSDSGNSRVVVYNLGGGISDGMNASNVLGQANFTSGSCGTNQDNVLCTPDGVAYDSTHNRLYVGDTDRVMIFDLSGGISNGMSAVNLLGQSSFTGTFGCSFIQERSTCSTLGLSYNNATNDLFVSDKDSHRISVFDMSGSLTNFMSMSDVVGQLNLQVKSQHCSSNFNDPHTHDDFSDWGISRGGLCEPLDSSFDETSNTLYVSDTSNQRVLSFSLSPKFVTQTSLPNGVVGQAYSQTVNTLYGQDGLSFSVTSGSLPAGLNINSSSGVISGNPITEGSYNFTVQMTDNNSQQISQAFTILVKHGTSGYQASDVVGQLDGNGNPQFDTNNHPHHPSPNYAGFSYTAATAIDTVGHRLFVVDESNHRVEIFNLDSSNNLIDRLADAVLGEPDLSTSNCNTAQDSLCAPYMGLAYDSAHQRLFVADSSNNRVLIYDLTGGVSSGMNASHVLGQPDFTSSNCNATQDGLCFPEGIAYDPANDRLLVADASNVRVLSYDLAGGISDGMNASHVLGQPDFVSSSGNTTQNTLSDPEDIAYDTASHQLFVGDSFNNRVMMFDLSGGISDGMNASHVLGQPDFTSSNSNVTQNGFGRFMEGLEVDPLGHRLFVSDDDNNRIMVFDITSITDGENAVNVLGQPDFVSSGCNTSQSELCDPEGHITYNPASQLLYIPDSSNARLLIYDLSGGISNGMNAADVVGQTGSDAQPSFNTSNGDNPNFYADATDGQPSTAVLDPVHHRLFVDDCFDYRVTVYSLDANNQVIDYHAMAVLGQLNFTNQDFFINGNATQYVVGCPFVGMVYDSAADRLFVSGEWPDRISVFDLAGGITNGMNASYQLGTNDFTTGTAGNPTVGGPSQNFFGRDPTGLAYDSLHKWLFVADESPSRILVYDLSGGISNAMNASYVLGQPDFTSYQDHCSTSGRATQNGFCNIEDLYYDETHQRLFVGDGSQSANNRVMVFDLSGGISDGMNASNVIGQPDFTSGDSHCYQNDTFNQIFVDATKNSFCVPTGFGYDPNTDTLFVSDENNNRVMLFDLSGGITNGLDAVGVLGQVDFAGGANSTSTVGLYQPFGQMSYDPVNKYLYVPDSNNNRVMVYHFMKITTSSLPGGTQNSAYSQTVNLTSNQGMQNFSITSGSLPPGLNIGAQSGTISGTPTAPGIYNFTLKNIDDNGDAGAFSDAKVLSINIAAAPGDNQPPTAPSGLLVTGVSCSTISLSWNASSDNVGVTGYNIYRDGGSTPIGQSNTTTYTDTGLAGGSTHSYTVTAFDAAGNESPQSNAALGTTSSCGGTSGGGGGGTTSSPPPSHTTKPPVIIPTSTPPNSPPPINLNKVPPVTSEGVCSNLGTATTGQVYSFTAKDGSNHKVTILKVGPDAIVVQIDNLPKTLHIGDLISQDVNGDGVPDICIEVVSITGGSVEIKISRIVFATAPGGHTSSGFGAGNSQADKHHKTPLILRLIFPWLLFILLGMSAARLAWQSLKERRLAATLAKQLAVAKALSEEKTNFVTLSSHYMRTPVTAIANGVELLAGINPANPANQELVSLGHQLSSGVNNLLTQARRQPSEVQPVNPQVINPLSSLAPQAAGFIKISTLPAITLTIAGSFVAVIIADYIIKHTNIYDVSLVNFLTQLAALLAISIFFYASFRSHRKNKEYREKTELLLSQQRELDLARNTLVKNSLQNLRFPLAELKTKVQANLPANPQVAKPALDGIAQLEGLVNKFTILASLESGNMSKAQQQMELNQLAGQIIQRYDSVLQSKALSVKQNVPHLQLTQDPLLLTFVIDSLLNNAIKYSPQGSVVELGAHRTLNGVEIFVKDSGPGIDEAKQAELFQPFSRAENVAQDFNRQGAGLSLYLDKLVMHYLGGQIGIDSGPGHGTTVRLTI